MATFLLSRFVRPTFSACVRPFLARSAAYSTEKGQAVVEKGETVVDTTADDEQVRFWLIKLFGFHRKFVELALPFLVTGDSIINAFLCVVFVRQEELPFCLVYQNGILKTVQPGYSSLPEMLCSQGLKVFVFGGWSLKTWKDGRIL
jgi:hypothetical protein